ncbi:hypothetical protein [Roseateles paludis]|uniref:SMI1/KNR4 family protein n=1 Tax=Roseateles paludis TaxID=3145238 RepID=A0ABV0FXP0_9BURK
MTHRESTAGGNQHGRLFGAKQGFGIEVMTEPGLSAPSAVWGRMRVWCAGESIGDFSEPHCALYESYLGFKRLAGRLPNLWHVELDGLSDQDLWNHFDGLLYGYRGDEPQPDDRTLEQCRADEQTWGDYNFLTNWGEQFDDDGKSFILCRSNGEVLILNRAFSEEHGLSATLPVADVLGAIFQFLEWFESEANRLASPI